MGSADAASENYPSGLPYGLPWRNFPLPSYQHIMDLADASITVLVAGLAGFAATVFRSYGTEKGKNLATLEDVQRIERQLNETRSELKLVEARIERSSHLAKLVQAAEFEALKQLWEAIANLRGASHRVTVTPGSEECRKEFARSFIELRDAFAKFEPFVDITVMSAIDAVIEQGVTIGIDLRMQRPAFDEDPRALITEFHAKAKAAAESIRRRIHLVSELPNLLA